MSVFVFEGIDRPGRKLFTLMGADYRVTSYAWLNLPLMIAVGLIVAFFVSPAEQAARLIMMGIGYGLLIILGIFVHGLGHIMSSRAVDAPVSYILITATVNVTHYDDDGPLSSRVHVGRSLGGPLANLLVAVVVAVLYAGGTINHFVLFFGAVNLLMGVMTLLPIPTLDGALIWHELLHWQK